MQLMEHTTIIPTQQGRRESTRILYRNSRNGRQQILDNGFGKAQNIDFENLHYQEL